MGNPLILFTKRLDIVAATLDHITVELEAPERLPSLLKARVEPGWPPGEYDRGAQEFFRDRMIEGGATAAGWYVWYAIRRESPDQPAVLVGSGGYFGPPNDQGEVEIGFSVMPSWQGVGFASEIAGALIGNAFSDSRVRRVIAHTTPSNLASRAVLVKCGFRPVSGEPDESGNILFEIRQSARERDDVPPEGS